MVIIDLMAALMGVAMGFLAFLVLGGLSGLFAWSLYPGVRVSKPGVQKLLKVVLLGFLAALTSSYLGQFMGYFQSGQMLEWLSAMVASSVAGGFYRAIPQK